MDGGQVAGHLVLGQNPDLQSSLTLSFSNVEVGRRGAYPFSSAIFAHSGSRKLVQTNSR